MDKAPGLRREKQIKIVAYTDDLVILISEYKNSIVQDRAVLMLDRLLAWSTDRGLFLL